MFKYIIVLLSIFSVGSARIIGDNPRTWTPNFTLTPVTNDKCDSCMMIAGNFEQYLSTHEQEIVTEICKEPKCKVVAEDGIKKIEKVLKDPYSICEDLGFCKTFWSKFKLG
jgi:hypothetical protein